eukprot:PhF_6_TR13935/c0_g1_i3/m.22411
MDPNLTCSVLTLPFDVLAIVFSCVPGIDAVQSRAVCRRFHHVLHSPKYRLWSRIAETDRMKEFLIHPVTTTSAIGFMEYCTLRKYDKYVGFWMLENYPRGGLALVQATLEPRCRLIGYQFDPTQNEFVPLSEDVIDGFSSCVIHSETCKLIGSPFEVPLCPIVLTKIQPSTPFAGLFSGLYGGHGWELVSIMYLGNVLLGRKLIGDANVPASQITFAINTAAFIELDDVVFPLEEGVRVVLGEGTIADPGFMNSKKIPVLGLLPQDDHDRFDIFFVPLNHRIQFRRVTIPH